MVALLLLWHVPLLCSTPVVVLVVLPLLLLPEWLPALRAVLMQMGLLWRILLRCRKVWGTAL